jgi:protocatechuate 3,4-dioxygenase beta subunit
MSEDERRMTRRELLRLGVAASVASVWCPTHLFSAEAPLLSITPGAILGPFYPVVKPEERDTDLTRLSGHRGRAKGQAITVAGRVLTQRGEPVRGARVELWHANTFGRYNHPSDQNPAPLDPDFQGYGEQLTDGEGRFRFTTIKPGPYPFDTAHIRAPHLHFDVTGRTDRRVTQVFFAGEPLNEHDFVLQSVPSNRDKLVVPIVAAPPDEDPESRFVHWDLVLRRG